MLQLLNRYMDMMRGMNGMSMNDVINECECEMVLV